MPPEKSSLKKHKASHHRRQARVITHMRMSYLKRQSKLDKSAEVLNQQQNYLSVCLRIYLEVTATAIELRPGGTLTSRASYESRPSRKWQDVTSRLNARYKCAHHTATHCDTPISFSFSICTMLRNIHIEYSGLYPLSQYLENWGRIAMGSTWATELKLNNLKKKKIHRPANYLIK